MNFRKKILVFLLALLLLLGTVPAAALPSEANADFPLGNLPINSLNGGVFLQDGDRFFVADPNGIRLHDTLLTDEPGRNLNLQGDVLYYTVFHEHSDIRRLHLQTGQIEPLFSLPNEIAQMLLTDGNLLHFLADGVLHTLNLDNKEHTTSETHSDIWRFVPTAYGMIYATGNFGDLTLWAGSRLLDQNVTQFFTEDEHLIIRRGASDYEISFADAFLRENIEILAYESRIQALSMDALAHEHTDDFDCPSCLAIATEIEPDLNILPLEMIETFSLPLTQSQENVVLRARQQLEIRWTPLEDITGWRGNHIFRAGETQIGIPYGQPIHSGRYVPWGASLEHFANAVKNIHSNMYTNFSFNGTHATIAPFYASDCSSFVSWALNHPQRTTTHTFPQHANRITQSLYAVQVGDVFNSAPHNILVTAVEFDANGNLVAVETMEQTIPLPRHRRYGVGGPDGGLDALINRTFNGGYHLYRSHTIDNVPFTPSPAVNVEPGLRHLVTASAGTGGVISPSGIVSVPTGDSQRFVFHAQPGYSVSRVLVNGIDVGSPTSHTLQNVQADATISVEFTLSSSPFADVRAGDWFYDAVLYVFANNLMQGVSDTQFQPMENATRAMFVTILGRMAGINPHNYMQRGTVTIAPGTVLNLRSGPSLGHAIIGQMPSGATVDIIGQSGNFYRVRHGQQEGFASRDHITSARGAFTDVSAGTWYAPYVQWAYEQGITSGTGEGRFSPAQSLNRQEMVTLLYNFTREQNIPLPQQNMPTFTDFDTIAPWARDAVVAAQRAGIVQGVGQNQFAPTELANRASLAVMIANFHEMIR